jgi:type I restriction enzyme R subunit
MKKIVLASTFAFSYEEALDHTPPYLCDFQVMKIKTKFQDEGLSKRTISLEDQKRLILEGKDIEEVNFEGTDLEKSVINIDTNRLIVKAYMEECIKDDNGVLPSKTIFFCMTKAHARRVEELFDELYPEHIGVQLVNIMKPLAASIKGKTIGERVIIGDTNSEVEIIEIR